ncbi:TonB-dependent receptor [Sphingomonas colocasiae]|uniref:TonB-dependent receptor n=1 Tax=Sphingomonas colocasiae TaxID=1848973 RepID=A0ABS7PXV2_9SPHN|nr:TonB-dependent receptor [Sphingomonas colocasiae]
MWRVLSRLSHQAFRATATGGGIVIQRDNAFLSPAIRAAMGATTSFRLGRFLDDIGPFKTFALDYQRDQVDGAIGIDGRIGASWRYSAYYNHGEYRTRSKTFNQTITANFNNAVDAITSPTTGLPICRVALTDPNTACRPLNLLGQNNASDDAIAYAFGAALSINRILLDSAGASLRGDLFSTWAGPVSLATGVEARWESIVTDYIDPLSQARAFGFDNRTRLNGGFNVKEGFVELAVPLLNAEGVATIDVNGAARYSDYSNSGGIWSWKVGGTVRLFDDIRLRAVYSRDIRSPNISELYSDMVLGVGSVADPFNGNNAVTYRRYTGGNPDLQPEIGHTLTLGGSWTPAAVPGLSLSVDAYRIDIDGVIGTITLADALAQCFAGSAVACSTIQRQPDGTILAFGNFQNLAFYKTRGVDFEIGYRLPVTTADLDGAIRFRLLGTYVDKFIVNNGVTTLDRVGDIGNAAFAVPWRFTATVGWEGGDFSADARVRYVGRGYQDRTLPIINNRIAPRAYLDLSAQYRIGDAFSIYANINNVFDRDPPLSSVSPIFHDSIGRYFSGGVRLNF